MKKTVIITILFLLASIVIFLNGFQYFKSTMNANLLEDVEGTIYYTKRVDGVLTLFKSDASLQNETLIYSHKGKGKDNYGGNNDNIIDFHYDKAYQTISFIAMHDGSWSMFSLKDGETKPTLKHKQEMMEHTEYIQNQFENLSVIDQQGSLYLLEDGNEKVIKKFHGIYDGNEKFTGYTPIGFSPDGKYLVYHSMEHVTSLGTILEGLFQDSVGHTYIMDLSTMKSTRYIDAYTIQWITKTE
ncbi:hypothetical protein [Bacillus timonensis]|uniref:hypothetical protein n=1 Tax=Bacillus timonensis TaxID=1033734 RepID=UPI0002890B4A|nr:hypothetical protein [Bacillus timonensis]